MRAARACLLDGLLLWWRRKPSSVAMETILGQADCAAAAAQLCIYHEQQTTAGIQAPNKPSAGGFNPGLKPWNSGLAAVPAEM